MESHSIAPPPYRIAQDTWVIPEYFPAGPDAFVPINSMVIAGAEPVVVDTGTFLNRERWLDAVGSIVDPADVKWIYLSHDDHDHVGNLEPMLELAPQATLVTTWFSLERLAGDIRPPLERVRWVRDGESFDIGDRTLHAHRPPIYDGPTTRGLFDDRTGVFWAADAFASLVPDTAVEQADTTSAAWEESFLRMNSLVSPWHSMVDPVKYEALISRVASLPITTVASGHTPTLRADQLGAAFGLLRRLPGMEAAVELGQDDLDAILQQVLAAV